MKIKHQFHIDDAIAQSVSTWSLATEVTQDILEDTKVYFEQKLMEEASADLADLTLALGMLYPQFLNSLTSTDNLKMAVAFRINQSTTANDPLLHFYSRLHLIGAKPANAKAGAFYQIMLDGLHNPIVSTRLEALLYLRSVFANDLNSFPIPIPEVRAIFELVKNIFPNLFAKQSIQTDSLNIINIAQLLFPELLAEMNREYDVVGFLISQLEDYKIGGDWVSYWTALLAIAQLNGNADIDENGEAVLGSWSNELKYRPDTAPLNPIINY